MREDVSRIVKEQRKNDYTLSVGNVQHIEDISKDFNLGRKKESREIMEMYDAIDSIDEISAETIINIIFDGSFDRFIDFVDATNKDENSGIEDNISVLIDLMSALSRLKSEGSIDDLFDDGIINKNERNALSSLHLLENISKDLTNGLSKNVLLGRISSDMASVFRTIKDEFDRSDYRFMEDNPIINKLVDLGIIKPNKSRGVVFTDKDKNTERSSGRYNFSMSKSKVRDSRNKKTYRRSQRRSSVRNRSNRRYSRRDNVRDRDDRDYRRRDDRRDVYRNDSKQRNTNFNVNHQRFDDRYRYGFDLSNKRRSRRDNRRDRDYRRRDDRRDDREYSGRRSYRRDEDRGYSRRNDDREYNRRSVSRNRGINTTKINVTRDDESDRLVVPVNMSSR